MDGPGKKTAEYLIDFIDYADEAPFDLPKNGLERLKILLGVIREIAGLRNIEEIVIAMTECNEIESTQRISIEEFENIAIADFIKYPPPNKIYIINAS